MTEQTGDFEIFPTDGVPDEHTGENTTARVRLIAGKLRLFASSFPGEVELVDEDTGLTTDDLNVAAEHLEGIADLGEHSELL